MLHELQIRNFAIIDDLNLHFGMGLNIVTGETGAGKSIIIDALGMLLGDRATAEWVRAGSTRAEIEASFQLPADEVVTASDEIPTLTKLLEEEGLDDPDNAQWVVLSREVRKSGRNVCRVNGRVVRLQILSQVASYLVDVHGQGTHLSLLQPKTHIHLLDRYAGLLPMREQVSTQAYTLRAVRAELQRLRQDARTIAQRIDILSYQATEIAEAALQPGEETQLDNERRRLSNAETLLHLAQATTAILSEGEGGMPSAVDLLSDAAGRVERLARIDPDMEAAADEGQALAEQVADLARTLQDYADDLEFNPDRLQEIEDRLELISDLKRKYGDTIEQILIFGEQSQTELDSLGNWETKTAELETQEDQLLRSIGELAAELTVQRQAAGEKMARQVEIELADLRMERAQFAVAVEQTEQSEGAYLSDGRRVAFDNTGVDRVAFMISANPGEPLKPMAKVASGGETARLMLALKSVLAHADATPTLIFDEIDQGIGGRVGSVVGQKLWQLTCTPPILNGHTSPIHQENHQVLCITHLPQLAAFGDQHFTVQKEIFQAEGQERTRTRVELLKDEARIHELMQMLGASTAAGRRSVEEMMGEVAAMKSGG